MSVCRNYELDKSPVSELIDSWFPTEGELAGCLRARLQLVKLPAAQDVFRLGDACRSYLVVIEGTVRVQALSSAGREVVLYRVTDGQSCVLTTACLISGERYPAEAVTETETVALSIPHSVFTQALAQSEAFQRFVFASQGRRLSDLIQRIEDVTFGRIDARLARLLLDRGGFQGSIVAATHQQLASELGTAREVVSRRLKLFEKQGWIRVLRGGIELCQCAALLQIGGETD
jgi:CRP/FNR family transcriptional regulator